MTARRKVLAVFGTRPEAIKMAPVLKELYRHPEWFATNLCVTGQHREMLDQMLTVFGLTPDHDLNIMQPNQSLTDIVTRCLERLDQVVQAERPDLVLVHGDTHTTFTASLAAFYNKVPLAHVEAGLRAFDKYSPWPEEMNRRLTGALADLHFAPTATNRDNLLREGVDPDRIRVTGNSVIDAVLMTLRPDYAFQAPALQALDLTGHRVVLVTAHRRENWGEFAQMFQAMLDLVEAFPDLLLVFPVHLSPAVRVEVERVLVGRSRVVLMDPLHYADLIHLMARSHLVLSDSGGMQEETPTLGKPLLLMRDTTERPEGLAAGTVIKVGTRREVIVAEASRLLTDPAAYRQMAQRGNPYGDGRAAWRIAHHLGHYFGFVPDAPPPFVSGGPPSPAGGH